MKTRNPYISSDAIYELTLYSMDIYELECFVFEDAPNQPCIFVRNTQTDTYNLIGDFFRVHWWADEVRNDLIPTLDEILNRGLGDEVIVSTLVIAWAFPDITYVINSNGGNLKLEAEKETAMKSERTQLKTSDFRKISLKWLEFLESRNL